MCGCARLVLAWGLGTHRARHTWVCFRAVCERARRQEPVLCVHVLSVCEPPPLAAVQAPLPACLCRGSLGTLREGSCC